MKSIILKLLAVVVVIGVFSCKKESAKSRTELLTQAGWRETSAEMKTGASGTWGADPSFTSLSACEKDDITLFKTGGVFEVNEGATKCSASDPQLIYTGAWAFQNNETEISIVGQGVASIEVLNETTLVITYSDTFGGTTYYYIETYVH
jgi:hypothetical protein